MKALVFLCVLSWVGAASAAELQVAVGAIDGKGGGTKAIAELQTELKRLGDIRIHTTKELQRAAADEGVADRLPDDARALGRLCAYLEIDAVIFGGFAGGGRRGPGDLRLTVYNGGDGAILGEHTFSGKPGKAFWRHVAQTLEPDLRRGSRYPPRAVAPPPPVTPEPVVLPVEPVPVEDVSASTTAGKAELLRVRGGLSFMSRSFEYTADGESPQFTDGGIRYESSMAPGVAIEAELYPLATATDGPGRDFGIGVRFEKTFLGATRQEVTLDDGTTEEHDLETKHQHLTFDLRYRHRFGEGDASPEISAFAGMGLLDFELESNPEYRGTSYRYWRLGLGAVVPFGTPLIGADVRFQFFPSANLGDTVEELGDEASTSGFGVYGGLVSRIGNDFTAHAGFDLTALDSDVKGKGREGRVGKSAEDRYLGVRVLAGYQF